MDDDDFQRIPITRNSLYEYTHMLRKTTRIWPFFIHKYFSQSQMYTEIIWWLIVYNISISYIVFYFVHAGPIIHKMHDLKHLLNSEYHQQYQEHAYNDFVTVTNEHIRYRRIHAYRNSVNSVVRSRTVNSEFPMGIY